MGYKRGGLTICLSWRVLRGEEKCESIKLSLTNIGRFATLFDLDGLRQNLVFATRVQEQGSALQRGV